MKKRRNTVVLGLILICPLAAALSSSASAAGPSSAGAQAAGAPAHPLNILLTNDDGWRGPGGSDTPLVVALRNALKAAGHRVTVVASGTDQTGQSGRISLPPQQLSVASPEPAVWTVTPGSPSDSVFFAFDQIYSHQKPDLVISGINPGNNMGQAANHSGTVNAATTALEFGVPSMAVSLETPGNWPEGTTAAAKSSAGSVVDLVRRLEKRSRHGVLMPRGVGLNVNYPVREGPVDPATGKPGSVLPPKGVRATTLDTGPFASFDYKPANGQAGQPGTYTIGLGLSGTPGAKGTDIRAVREGFVSVTPLETDRDVNSSTHRWLRGIL
jgi:5'-nucleotidase